MNRRKTASILSLAFLCAVSVASIAQTTRSNAPSEAGVVSPDASRQPAAIVGRVKSEDPAANLRGVVVVLHRDGRPVARTVTNDKGEFRFLGIRPGPFALTAAKPEVGGGIARGVAKPGEPTRVQIELKKRG